MLSKRFASAFLILLAGARHAIGWNGTGHEITALIAWQDLTPQTRENVTRLLTAHPDYADMLTKADTPADDKPREAFLTAAAWPDLVRTPGRKSYRYNHPAWHYVDLPFAIGMDPPELPDEKWEPGKDPANAAQAWKKNVADLMDPKLSDADRGIALCWVEHLAGDIHQPLHSVSFFSPRLPKGDQGGNLLLVKDGANVTNLHALWDAMLGTDQSFENINKEAQRIRAAHTRSDLAFELKANDSHRWIESSAERAKSVAYIEGTLPFVTRDEMNQDKSRPVPELPVGYMEKAHATADYCAALAGYRLADRLNEWLGK